MATKSFQQQSVAKFPTSLLSVGMQSIPQDTNCRVCSSGSRFRTKVCIQSRVFRSLEMGGLFGASCR